GLAQHPIQPEGLAGNRPGAGNGLNALSRREREGPAPARAWEGEGLRRRGLAGKPARDLLAGDVTPHPPARFAVGPLPLPLGEVDFFTFGGSAAVNDTALASAAAVAASSASTSSGSTQ